MDNNCSLIKYTDAALWGILDALVGDQGRVRAGEALGVNYRTLKSCLNDRQLTRRMREALQEFGNLAPLVGKQSVEAGEAGSLEESAKTLAQLMADLEAENKELRDVGGALAERMANLEAEMVELQETNESQGAHLKDLDRWIGALVRRELRPGILKKMGLIKRGKDRDAIIAGFGNPPGPGVFTVNHKLGEENALGPAAPLVDE